MKVFILSPLLLLVASTDAFTTQPMVSIPSSSSTSLMMGGYVPDGFTAESYKKFKEEELKKKQANLGRLGPRGFESRSMQSFQEALERGEAAHLMPVFNAKEKIARGEIRKEDVPYMQRGGKWDNSDISSAKNKKKWLASDKKYAAGGYKKEQSVSIFGNGVGLDWTGTQGRTGPSESIPAAAPKFGRNYRAPNINTMKGATNTNNNNNKKTTNNPSGSPKKKGLFGGLF